MLTDVPWTLPQRSDNLLNAHKDGNDTPLNQENDIDGLQSIRRSLETQGISKRASDIILQSWRQGKRKRSASYIKRWIKYCHRKHVSCVDPSISQALDFLAELYDKVSATVL